MIARNSCGWHEISLVSRSINEKTKQSSDTRRATSFGGLRNNSTARGGNIVTKVKYLNSASLIACASLAFSQSASAGSFDIARGDLKAALNAYAAQSGVLVVS